MTHDLEPYENITRVFWIKIELKDNRLKGRHIIGEIKDVMSGQRQVICELCDIVYFVIPYLEHMGIKIRWFWRLGHLLEQKRRKQRVVISSATPEDSEPRAKP